MGMDDSDIRFLNEIPNSELNALLEGVILQAGIARNDSRGAIVLKLMRTLSSQDESFPIIEASASLDRKYSVILQVVIDGCADVVFIDTTRIIEIACPRKC